MNTKLLGTLFFSIMLMAFQCEKEPGPEYVFGRYSVAVTPKKTFLLGDTIWLTGTVTSKVYEQSMKDSLFLEWTEPDNALVMNFFEPNGHSNCKDAIDRFELLTEIGSVTYLPRCINSLLIIQPQLSSDSLFFKYRIGLIPLFSGDYVFSWYKSYVTNQNRNFEILDNYQIPQFPNQLGFDLCGDISWRPLSESDSDFLFIVD